MKKFLFVGLAITMLSFCIIAGNRYYQEYKGHQKWLAFQETISDTASPNVQVLRDSIAIPYQGGKRTVHVYLPPDYHSDSTKRYPVMYFMDGASSFSDLENMDHEWRIDEVMDSAHQIGQQTAIVFGIEGAEDRDAEYTPWANEDNPNAHGERFGQWLGYEFKAWVDSTYRTDPAPAATTIGGISRSGMMAYYLTMAYPDAFGNAVIQSPAMWVDEDRLLAMSLPEAELKQKKFFISVGSYEGGIMIPNAENIYNKLKTAGLDEDHLQIQIIPNEGHSHITWCKSFALAYPFLF